MSHLSFDEIVEYASIDHLSEQALLLCSKVDGHVGRCKECLELVNAIETLHEEFARLQIEGSFAGFLEKRAARSKKTNKRLAELKLLFPKNMELDA